MRLDGVGAYADDGVASLLKGRVVISEVTGFFGAAGCIVLRVEVKDDFFSSEVFQTDVVSILVYTRKRRGWHPFGQAHEAKLGRKHLVPILLLVRSHPVSRRLCGGRDVIVRLVVLFYDDPGLANEEVQLFVGDIGRRRCESHGVFAIEATGRYFEVLFGKFLNKIAKLVGKVKEILCACIGGGEGSFILEGDEITAAQADDEGIALGNELDLRGETLRDGGVFFFFARVVEGVLPVGVGEVDFDPFFFPCGVCGVIAGEAGRALELDENYLLALPLSLGQKNDSP